MSIYIHSNIFQVLINNLSQMPCSIALSWKSFITNSSERFIDPSSSDFQYGYYLILGRSKFNDKIQSAKLSRHYRSFKIFYKWIYWIERTLFLKFVCNFNLIITTSPWLSEMLLKLLKFKLINQIFFLFSSFNNR